MVPLGEAAAGAIIAAVAIAVVLVVDADERCSALRFLSSVAREDC